jgi:hypothetical protein
VLVVEDGTTAECIATLAVDDLYEEAVGATGLTPRLDSAVPAPLIYTSGTTGVPGLMLDHSHIEAMASMGCRAVETGPNDRCLRLQGGGGSQRGALGTDDNAADVRAEPRGPGVIQMTGPSRGPRRVEARPPRPRDGRAAVRSGTWLVEGVRSRTARESVSR